MINDDECIIKWLKLIPEDDKAAWASQAQISPQHARGIPPGTALLPNAPIRGKYAYPPVPPAAVVGLKREAESVETTHDPYHQHAMGGYNPATGLPHPYGYSRPGPQYWAYPPVAIPPPPRQNIPHGYLQVQQQPRRPISPAPAVNSPGRHMIGGPALSPSVTAGEAAAMRRKKPRREYEGEDTPDSRHPHPSPPPPPPAPILTQLHHQNPNYSLYIYIMMSCGLLWHLRQSGNFSKSPVECGSLWQSAQLGTVGCLSL